MENSTNSAQLTSMSTLSAIIVGALILSAIIAAIYFIIYQRHINKALKNGETDKKSRVRLPSIGSSYTGMWFIAWVIVSCTLIIQTVEVNTYVKNVNTEMSSVKSQLAKLQDNHEWYANWIYGFFAESVKSKYVRYPKFSVGAFDPETNTIELKVEVNIENMSKDDKLTIRIGDVSSALKPDLKNQKFTGTIKTDIFSIGKDTANIDCTFIIESDGVKKTEYYDISNYYNRDDDLKINWAHYFPMLYSYSDVTNYELFSTGTDDNQIWTLDCNVDFAFSPAQKLSDRNFVSGKIVYKVDGQKIDEEILDLPKNQTGEFTYTKAIHKEWESVEGLQAVFEGTDNYGYTYSIPLDTLHPEKEKELYTISDKDGNILFSSRDYRNFI